MPYIAKEQVAGMRKQLRKEFPEFKMSIRKVDGHAVYVTLKSGPVDFGVNYEQVNHFYIDEHWKGEARKVLSRINEIISNGNGIEVYDGDYGAVPDWYVRIQIGDWDMPYQVA